MEVDPQVTVGPSDHAAREVRYEFSDTDSSPECDAHQRELAPLKQAWVGNEVGLDDWLAQEENAGAANEQAPEDATPFTTVDSITAREHDRDVYASYHSLAGAATVTADATALADKGGRATPARLHDSSAAGPDDSLHAGSTHHAQSPDLSRLTAANGAAVSSSTLGDAGQPRLAAMKTELERRMRVVLVTLRRAMIVHTSAADDDGANDAGNSAKYTSDPESAPLVSSTQAAKLLRTLEAAELELAQHTTEYVQQQCLVALRQLNAKRPTAALRLLVDADVMTQPGAGKRFTYTPEASEARAALATSSGTSEDVLWHQQAAAAFTTVGASTPTGMSPTDSARAPSADRSPSEVYGSASAVPAANDGATTPAEVHTAPATPWEVKLPYYAAALESARLKARATVLNNRGLYHFQMGEHDLAKQFLEEAVTIESALTVPTIGVTHFNLAQANWALANQRLRRGTSRTGRDSTASLTSTPHSSTSALGRAGSAVVDALRSDALHHASLAASAVEQQVHHHHAKIEQLEHAHALLREEMALVGSPRRDSAVVVDDEDGSVSAPVPASRAAHGEALLCEMEDTKRRMTRAWAHWREALCLLAHILAQHARWLRESRRQPHGAVHLYEQSIRWLSAVPNRSTDEQHRLDALRRVLVHCRRDAREEKLQQRLYGVGATHHGDHASSFLSEGTETEPRRGASAHGSVMRGASQHRHRGSILSSATPDSAEARQGMGMLRAMADSRRVRHQAIHNTQHRIVTTMLPSRIEVTDCVTTETGSDTASSSLRVSSSGNGSGKARQPRLPPQRRPRANSLGTNRPPRPATASTPVSRAGRPSSAAAVGSSPLPPRRSAPMTALPCVPEASPYSPAPIRATPGARRRAGPRPRYSDVHDVARRAPATASHETAPDDELDWHRDMQEPSCNSQGTDKALTYPYYFNPPSYKPRVKARLYQHAVEAAATATPTQLGGPCPACRHHHDDAHSSPAVGTPSSQRGDRASDAVPRPLPPSTPDSAAQYYYYWCASCRQWHLYETVHLNGSALEQRDPPHASDSLPDDGPSTVSPSTSSSGSAGTPSASDEHTSAHTATTVPPPPPEVLAEMNEATPVPDEHHPPRTVDAAAQTDEETTKPAEALHLPLPSSPTAPPVARSVNTATQTERTPIMSDTEFSTSKSDVCHTRTNTTSTSATTTSTPRVRSWPAPPSAPVAMSANLDDAALAELIRHLVVDEVIRRTQPFRVPLSTPSTLDDTPGTILPLSSQQEERTESNSDGTPPYHREPSPPLPLDVAWTDSAGPTSLTLDNTGRDLTDPPERVAATQAPHAEARLAPAIGESSEATARLGGAATAPVSCDVSREGEETPERDEGGSQPNRTSWDRRLRPCASSHDTPMKRLPEAPPGRVLAEAVVKLAAEERGTEGEPSVPPPTTTDDDVADMVTFPPADESQGTQAEEGTVTPDASAIHESSEQDTSTDGEIPEHAPPDSTERDADLVADCGDLQAKGEGINSSFNELDDSPLSVSVLGDDNHHTQVALATGIRALAPPQTLSVASSVSHSVRQGTATPTSSPTTTDKKSCDAVLAVPPPQVPPQDVVAAAPPPPPLAAHTLAATPLGDVIDQCSSPTSTPEVLGSTCTPCSATPPPSSSTHSELEVAESDEPGAGASPEDWHDSGLHTPIRSDEKTIESEVGTPCPLSSQASPTHVRSDGEPQPSPQPSTATSAAVTPDREVPATDSAVRHDEPSQSLLPLEPQAAPWTLSPTAAAVRSLLSETLPSPLSTREHTVAMQNTVMDSTDTVPVTTDSRVEEVVHHDAAEANAADVTADEVKPTPSGQVDPTPDLAQSVLSHSARASNLSSTLPAPSSKRVLVYSSTKKVRNRAKLRQYLACDRHGTGPTTRPPSPSSEDGANQGRGHAPSRDAATTGSSQTASTPTPTFHTANMTVDECDDLAPPPTGDFLSADPTEFFSPAVVVPAVEAEKAPSDGPEPDPHVAAALADQQNWQVRLSVREGILREEAARLIQHAYAEWRARRRWAP